MDNITNFLYLIGSVFAPMIAVQIADYFILKKADSEKNAFQWRNLIVWLAGFIIYRILMHEDTPLDRKSTRLNYLAHINAGRYCAWKLSGGYGDHSRSLRDCGKGCRSNAKMRTKE